MQFRTHKWGWKAAAARLLLAPLAVGAMALPAYGQQYPPAGTGNRPAAAPDRPTHPSDLLRLGRKALADGEFKAAEMYASEAAKANPSGRWGLWGDNPDKLVRDTRVATAKADRAEAERLTAQAKELFGRTAKTDAERIAYLDDAAARIDRACRLYGPTSFIEDINPLVARPEALKQQIDAARAQVRQRLPVAARPTTPTRPTASSVRQAQFDQPRELEQALPPTPPVSATARGDALKLMTEGRELLAKDKVVEARAKFTAADELKAQFSYSEDNPARGLRDALAAGKTRIDQLTEKGEKLLADREYAKAEVCLVEARQLSAGLDLYTRPVDAKLAAARRMTTGPVKVAAQAPDLPDVPSLPKAVEDAPKLPSLPKAVEDAPKLPPLPVKPRPMPSPLPVEVPDVVTPVEIGLPGLPDVKPAAKPVPAKPLDVPAAPLLPKVDLPAATPADEGHKLLDQAAAELKKGELEMAKKLAFRAHNGEYGVKADAQKLLREIEAEGYALKRKEAADTFKAAGQAATAKQFETAERLLALIEPSLLDDGQRTKYEQLTAAVNGELARLRQPAPAAVGAAPAPAPGGLIPSVPTAGTPGGLADQAKAMGQIEFQQLRSEGLQVETSSRQAFDRGDTDTALQLLADFSVKVKGSRLSAGQQTMLLNPIDRRAESFRIMKRHIDVTVKEAREKRDRIETRLSKTQAETQKQEEIAKRVRQVNELLATKTLDSYTKAEALALQTKQLAPDDPTLTLIHELAKRNRRAEFARIKRDQKEEFYYNGLEEAEKLGPSVTLENPIARNIERSRNALLRGDGSDFHIKSRTPIEREIELKLMKPLTVEFQNATLREVLGKFRQVGEMNIVVDDAALEAKGIDLDKVTVTEQILRPISLRNVMALILSKARLMHVIENDVVKVTTEERAKGRLYTKVFSVMDLVTPIPDFALPEHAVLSKALDRTVNPKMPWANQGGPTPTTPRSGLPNNTGQMVSQPFGAQPGSPFVPAGSGVLDNQQNPLSGSAFMAPTRQNASGKLMQMITKLVKPYSWDDMGGAGRLDYYDIGGALVVNQTADVLQEVTELLESLRRLQDLSVAVEIRILTLSEAFFERIGVDFQMNIKTNPSAAFNQSLTTGQFTPSPFINSIGNSGGPVGYNPAAGGFTSDLNIPIRPNTYGFSVPPFGGYPGNGNGGLNLGLAFLNDIQVFMFLEAAAGDRRASVMQAPKITLFNGQTSTILINDFQYFTTNLQILNVSGQFVYIPQNTPIGIGSQGQPGVSIAIQAVVTADRRFVRLNLPVNLSSLTSATVPLFPITAFLTPVFEGGSQGVPIPFTQFFQQPAFTDINVSTTVLVPDGGTVILGGLKSTAEARNEFGPPVISSVPYLNRLFRNTGIGRETRHLMIMVTPRIIIASEEEERATGER